MNSPIHSTKPDGPESPSAQPSEDLANAAYDQNVYSRYLSTSYLHRNDLSEEGLQRAALAYRRELEDFLPSDLSARILEIGCGAGAFLDLCHSLGFERVKGIDISEEQISFCRERGHVHVECVDGSSFLEKSGDKFDLVVLLDVVEHLSKAAGMSLLKAVFTHLVPGGRVLVRVPNMSNPLNIQARYGDFTHEVGFSKESLEQLFRISGFQVVFVRGSVGRHRNVLAHWVFDVLLWKLFLVFYKRTMQLKAKVHAGKNLLGVAERPDEAP